MSFERREMWDFLMWISMGFRIAKRVGICYVNWTKGGKKWSNRWTNCLDLIRMLSYLIFSHGNCYTEGTLG